MTFATPAAKITIISPSDMQRYADGELVGDDKRLMESALLSDERARQYVLDHASATEAKPSLKSMELLNICVSACEKVVLAYEGLSRTAPTETKRKLADDQFGERWKLLSDIFSVISGGKKSAQTISASRLPKMPHGRQLKQAARHDLALEKALQSVFDEPSPPRFKAKIAEWLVNLRFERDRIAWAS